MNYNQRNSAIIYAITNQKGGVGKTTTAINLSAGLAACHKKVLLIDLDPQSNATVGAGIDSTNMKNTMLNVLVDEMPIRDIIVPDSSLQFMVAPANGDLIAAEVEMIALSRKEYRLRLCLDAIKTQYDYIIIDCPPALGILTINALVATQGVIIPVQCEYFALEGLSALLSTVDKVRNIANKQLTIRGILKTMYDPRNTLTNDVSTQLAEHFGHKVFRINIPRNVRLAEAPSYGEHIISYDKNSKGAVAYLGLAGEITRQDLTHKT